MQQTQHHSTRRRPPLVRVVDLRPQQRAPIGVQERDAYVAGLGYAQLLREHWPAFFRDRVAQRAMRPELLLGVMGAFLSLAHTRLIQIDVDAHLISGAPMNYYGNLRWPFKPTNPADALAPWHGRTSSLAMLANEGAAWLDAPIPRVYGIVTEHELASGTGFRGGRSIDSGLCALTVWKLLAATTWAPLPIERIDELARTRAKDDQLGNAIAALKPLPAATPLAPLCAALDRASPTGFPRLGTMIAYLCSRTDNTFANVPQTALRDQAGNLIFNLSWATSDFTALRQQQDQAQSWHRSLSGTKGRFLRNWRSLLPIVRDAVHAAAVTVNNQSWNLTNDDTTYQPGILYWSLSI